tara:strand:+ start:320 stop:505 length:186 start_codon:yes stop_codon:yes gene_type:complete
LAALDYALNWFLIRYSSVLKNRFLGEYLNMVAIFDLAIWFDVFSKKITIPVRKKLKYELNK